MSTPDQNRPDGVTTEDVNGLREDTARLSSSIVLLASKQDLENERLARQLALTEKADTSKVPSKALVRAVIVALVLAALIAVSGVTVGVIGTVKANRADKAAAAAQTAVDRANAARADRGVDACRQDNIRIAQHNLLVDAGNRIQAEIDSLIGQTTNVPAGIVLTPDQQARLDVLVNLAAENKAAVDGALGASVVAARDCTPAGIDAYYSKTGG